MPINIAGSFNSFHCLKIYMSANVTPESRIWMEPISIAGMGMMTPS